MNTVALPLGSSFRQGCLRSLRMEDVPGMLSWMHDPETAQWFARDFMAATEADARSFVQSSWHDVSNVHLAVTDDRDTYLGTVSLKDVNPKTDTAEYAIAMTVGTRGTGAALAGTQKLIGLAFGKLGLREVWLCVRESNTRAIRFYTKAGFTPRTRRSGASDLHFFGMDRDDFAVLKQRHEQDRTLAEG